MICCRSKIIRYTLTWLDYDVINPKLYTQFASFSLKKNSNWMHSLFTFLILREPHNIILQQQKLTWVSFSDFILSDSASTSHFTSYWQRKSYTLTIYKILTFSLNGFFLLLLNHKSPLITSLVMNNDGNMAVFQCS